MKELITKIKGLRLFKNREVSLEKRGIKPQKQWSIVLFCFILFLILSGLLSFYFYLQIENGSLFSLEGKGMVQEIRINERLLKSVIDDLDLRKENLDKMKNGKKSPTNPAI